MSQFTEEDIGKPVHDAVYERVGIIASIENGTAYIKFDESITSEVKSTLGFENSKSGTYPLHDEMVESADGEVIRLRGEH